MRISPFPAMRGSVRFPRVQQSPISLRRRRPWTTLTHSAPDLDKIAVQATRHAAVVNEQATRQIPFSGPLNSLGGNPTWQLLKPRSLEDSPC
jgi:hypothetical protein